MDKAPAYGAGDSGFESQLALISIIVAIIPIHGADTFSSQHFSNIKVAWCSGYHVSFTRRRSRVQFAP